MSAQLEGAALFEEAAMAIGAPLFIADQEEWSPPWLLVPAMLAWLQPIARHRVIMDNRSDGSSAGMLWRNGSATCHGPDLPTALARLVLRVKAAS